jgi:putative RNA 2'-phosphotransferase
MDNQLVKTSKFLSLVLRHKPEKIQLGLDKNGWADVEELIEKAARAGMRLNKQQLHQVVAENDKKRFSFNEDATKIRANQGHSISVDLNLIAVAPPEVLYHGTATRFLDSIKSNGLFSGDRQHVHLSADEQTAISVGRRHGQPMVLVVYAGEMAQQGYRFYQSANEVWLTEKVPVEYIQFPA